MPNINQYGNREELDKSRINKTVLDGSEYDTATGARCNMVNHSKTDDTLIEETKNKKGEERKLHSGLVTDVLGPMCDALTYQERVPAHTKHNLQESGELDRIKNLYNISTKPKVNNIINLFG